MLLSDVICAILTDFVTAQDLSNEYASQISRKYMQYRDDKENILNNFEAPASVLKEIDLELKFAVTDLSNVSYGLDIEETWSNCRNIADDAVKSIIMPMRNSINEVIRDLDTLLPPQQPTTGIAPALETLEGQPRARDIEAIKNIWRQVSENLNKDQFQESVKKKITQKLFKTCKGLFLRGRESIDIESVKEIVRDKLKEGILKHPDIQEAIKRTQEIVDRINPSLSGNVPRFVEGMSNQLSQIPDNKNIVNQTNVRKLIQKLQGVVPRADIMVMPSFLRELPIETISSLKFKVQMDSYKWTLSATGESLHKAKT